MSINLNIFKHIKEIIRFLYRANRKEILSFVYGVSGIILGVILGVFIAPYTALKIEPLISILSTCFAILGVCIAFLTNKDQNGGISSHQLDEEIDRIIEILNKLDKDRDEEIIPSVQDELERLLMMKRNFLMRQFNTNREEVPLELPPISEHDRIIKDLKRKEELLKQKEIQISELEKTIKELRKQNK